VLYRTTPEHAVKFNRLNRGSSSFILRSNNSNFENWAYEMSFAASIEKSEVVVQKIYLARIFADPEMDVKNISTSFTGRLKKGTDALLKIQFV